MGKLLLEEVVSRLDKRGFEIVGGYVGSTGKKQRLRDRKCGYEWESTLTNVYAGTGCPRCSGNLPVTEQAASERLDVHGFEIVGKYVGSTKKSQTLRDRKCGHVWKASLNNVFKENGSRCPRCSKETSARKQSISVEEVTARLDERGFEIVGEYVGNTQKRQRLRDKKCGHEWTTHLHNVLKNKGTGCPKCSKEMEAIKKTIPVEEVVSRLAALGFEMVGEYVGGMRKPQKLRDTKCGHEWEATLGNVFYGTRCPKCAGTIPVTETEAAERLAMRGFEMGGQYVGSTHKVQPLRDRKCGHEWATTLSNVFNGTGCPKCSNEATALKLATPEQMVIERLSDLGFEMVGAYVGMITKPQRVRDRACGHEWETHLSNIFGRRGYRCPGCSKDVWIKQGIYHLHHAEVSYQYVGISWKPEVRLEEHQQDLGERGELARLIEVPYELTYAEVLSLYEVAWEEGRIPDQVSNWFESNPHGKLPPGRLWFVDWFNLSDKEKNRPARLPRFVAEWVETELIYQLSENFPTDNPFLQAGKVRLVNIAKNTPAALSC